MRLPAQSEEGFGLVELLIAMTVMSIGIAALVAGFSSGILSVNRARTASTAGALADRQMEAFRQGPYGAVQSQPNAPAVGSDGRTYWMQTDVDPKFCAIDTYFDGPPPKCAKTPDGPATSRPVKLVKITVSDPDSGRVLFTESTTFDASTG